MRKMNIHTYIRTYRERERESERERERERERESERARERERERGERCTGISSCRVLFWCHLGPIRVHEKGKKNSCSAGLLGRPWTSKCTGNTSGDPKKQQSGKPCPGSSTGLKERSAFYRRGVGAGALMSSYGNSF